eukprot:gb/GECH01010092.1/.p1 GENE.gb/GECH01010092.1/~~gb/GECH01010092.1/.p1  ORF type:complete len:379 (+),score=83.83 gb/GECH01010092.1/:1-1137(+)
MRVANTTRAAFSSAPSSRPSASQRRILSPLSGVRELQRSYSTKASALTFSKHGNLDNIKKETVDIPDPKGNQVLLKMLAAPINPADKNVIQGKYPMLPSLPAIGGSEGVGVVQEVGPEVENFKKDQRVIIGKPGHGGTWTTHNVFPEDVLDPVPKDIPVNYAALLAINPATAHRLLNDFVSLQKGDLIIQNASNSIVGQSVIQLCKAKKVDTINIIRDQYDEGEMIERLKHVGGSVVVDEDYAQSAKLRRMLSDAPPPKLALNCVGGSSATNLTQLLGDGGTMVTYGGMSRKPFYLSSTPLIFKDITLKGFWLQKWLSEHSAEERRAFHDVVIPMIRNRDMILFTEHHPLDDYPRALSKAFQSQVDRKMILRMEPGLH